MSSGGVSGGVAIREWQLVTANEKGFEVEKEIWENGVSNNYMEW